MTFGTTRRRLANVWLLAACACTAEGLPAREDSGQTGSPGGVECHPEEASDRRRCLDGAEQLATSLRSPATHARTFVDASCGMLSLQAGSTSASGLACMCKVEGGGHLALGPRGAGCYAWGRAGDCLWSDTEPVACTPAEHSAECRSACDELARRFAEDAARTHQVDVLLGDCREKRCRNVLRVDGRCYVDASFGAGATFAAPYDCALGAEAILAEHDARVSPLPEPASELPWSPPSAYVKGTRGIVEIGLSRELHGASETGNAFYASAQFFDLEGEGGARGEVVDPLTGIDDCTVTRTPSTGLGGTSPRFFSVDAVSVEDGGALVPVAPTPAHHEHFSSYGADLAPRPPRHGEPYLVRVSGSKLGPPLSLSITLPPALEVDSLAGVQRVAKGDLPLRWSGAGSEPLWLQLRIQERLANAGSSYVIDCLLQDDGAHVIPAAVLERAPSGFITAAFTRAERSIQGAGGSQLLAIGKVTTVHHLLLGEACDGSAAAAACSRFAAYQQQIFERCGTARPAPNEATCPDYLGSACGACEAYFDCQIAALTCGATGPTFAGTHCACP